MCIGGPGGGGGNASEGMGGYNAPPVGSSNYGGGGTGVSPGMPMAAPGPIPAMPTVAPIPNYGGYVGISSALGSPVPFGSNESGHGLSDIAAFNIGKGILGALGTILGVSALPVSAPLTAVAMMANAARGEGQPPGDTASMGMAGPPDTGMTFGSLTGVVPGLNVGQQQPQASEPRSVSMPVGDITSSLFSVPPPKQNLGNLMASRGVRGAGTKTASPEWFKQGKRGY